MKIVLKIFFLLFFLLLSVDSLLAQLGKSWPYSAGIKYELRGSVKSWTMIGDDGIIRKQLYDESSNPHYSCD